MLGDGEPSRIPPYLMEERKRWKEQLQCMLAEVAVAADVPEEEEDAEKGSQHQALERVRNMISAALADVEGRLSAGERATPSQSGQEEAKYAGEELTTHDDDVDSHISGCHQEQHLQSNVLCADWAELDDLVPHPAQDVYSPSPQLALGLWVDSNKRDALEVWLTHIVSGGEIEEEANGGCFVPRVQVAGLTEEARNAMLSAVFPLLLRRMGIKVHVYERQRVQVCYDLRVRVELVENMRGRTQGKGKEQDRKMQLAMQAAHGAGHVEESWIDSVESMATGFRDGLLRKFSKISDGQQQPGASGRGVT